MLFCIVEMSFQKDATTRLEGVETFSCCNKSICNSSSELVKNILNGHKFQLHFLRDVIFFVPQEIFQWNITLLQRNLKNIELMNTKFLEYINYRKMNLKNT